jgi:hypothetical protein
MFTPPTLISQHSSEVPVPSESNESLTHEFHPETSSPQLAASDPNEPTEMMFHLPNEEEVLLPSPLDTLELPEHAGVQNAPLSEEKPMFHQDNEEPTSMSVNSSIPVNRENNEFNAFPIPETKVVETLLSWRAPSRPHRKKNRSFYTTVAILIILIAMISLLAGERMLVAVLFALMFLVYVLNFIEPGEVEYKISTQGVTIENHFYHWQELNSFWFENKDGYSVMHILTQLKFPSMIMMVLGTSTSEESVRKIVARFLPYHEIAPKSAIEKWAEGLQKYFPLENPNK